jgi:acetylornithine deacetylase
MEMTESILKELVSIPSVSALTNAPIIRYAERLLAPCGWHLRRFEWRDDSGVEKINLVASSHPRADAELAFVGHTDTVPADVEWADAFQLVARDDRLHGLGTTDMKGFLASGLALFTRLNPRTLAKPLMLVLTADEEVGCLGAKRLAAESAIAPRRAVVGEPTQLAPVRAGKGYGLGRVIVRGCEAHSAFPEQGRSAIIDAAHLLARLEALADELAEERHAEYEPPYSTLNVGTISGGRAKNIIPGECEFQVEFRPVGGESPQRIRDRIAAALAEMRAVRPGLDFSFSAPRLDPGFDTPLDSELVAVAAALTGGEPATVSFGTEAPQMAALGAEVVVCGPGDMLRAHRRNEYITRGELAACDELLRSLVTRYCA